MSDQVVVARAPGKLVVMGEYAVLMGHVGIVAAVDVYATATRTPGRGRLRTDTGGLLQACVDEAVDTGVLDTAPTEAIDVDTRAFKDGAGRKLGLGSSAAAAVSFLATLLPDLDVDGLHAVAQRAHRRFQHGKGSGIDVAASVYGGLVQFTRKSDVADDVWGNRLLMRLEDASVRALVVWSGHSQDTRAYVAQVQVAQVADGVSGRSALPALTAMAEATQAFLAALAAGQGDALLRAVDGGRRALVDLGEAAAIDIVSAPHAAIAAIAARHGGTAKPSGAGGGDVALALVPQDAAAPLAAELEAAGFPVLPLRLGAPGVSVRREPRTDGR